MVNISFIKILLTILFLIMSATINYFILNNKKLFMLVAIIILVINIFWYLIDYLIIESDLNGYIASNMLLSFLLSITFEDIKTKLMDTRVIVGYFLLFLIYRIIFLDLAIFLEGLLGFGLSLIIMLIAYFVKKNSIGIGDIEAIATCGMIIGFPNIFHFLFKAFLFVFIAGVFLMITKKRKLLTELPFAPFLLLATIL